MAEAEPAVPEMLAPRPARRGLAVARALLGLAISAVCLWLVLRQVHWAEVVGALRHANPWLVAPAALLYPWRIAVISARWGVLLRVYDTKKAPALPYLARLRATGIGYLANNLLPLRSGEIIRAGIAVKAGAPLGPVASTLVFEKVLDVWALVACGMVFGAPYLAHAPLFAHSLRLLGLAAAASLLAYLGLAFLTDPAAGGQRCVASGRSLWERLARARDSLSRVPGAGPVLRVLRMLSQPVLRVLRVLSQCCRLCHRRDLLGLTALTTAVNWLIEASFYVLIAHSLGVPLTLPAALFVAAMIGLGLTIPSSPGGIGLVQYITVRALQLQGTDVTAATAYALLVYVVGYVCINSVGIVFLISDSLRGARKRSRTAAAQAGSPP